MNERREIRKQFEFAHDIAEMSRIDSDAQAREEADQNAADLFARLMASAASAATKKEK